MRSVLRRYQTSFNFNYELANSKKSKKYKEFIKLMKTYEIILQGDINQLLTYEIQNISSAKELTLLNSSLNAPFLNALIKNLLPEKIFTMEINEDDENLNLSLEKKLDKFALIMKLKIKDPDYKFTYVSPGNSIREKNLKYQDLTYENKKNLERLSSIDKNYSNFLIRNSSVTQL
jgi:hypothetical protein